MLGLGRCLDSEDAIRGGQWVVPDPKPAVEFLLFWDFYHGLRLSDREKLAAVACLLKKIPLKLALNKKNNS